MAAHVETDARRIAHVGSPVAGRILKLLVFEGQKVKAGTVLAMLHSTNLSDTQLALIKATSQQSLAAAAEKRAEQLVAADVIGRAELERRRAELLQAEHGSGIVPHSIARSGHDGAPDPRTGEHSQAQRRLSDRHSERAARC